MNIKLFTLLALMLIGGSVNCSQVNTITDLSALSDRSVTLSVPRITLRRVSSCTDFDTLRNAHGGVHRVRSNSTPVSPSHIKRSSQIFEHGTIVDHPYEESENNQSVYYSDREESNSSGNRTAIRCSFGNGRVVVAMGCVTATSTVLTALITGAVTLIMHLTNSE